MKYLLIVALLWLYSALALAVVDNPTPSTYVQAKVENGDGIYSLLRRYSLEESLCNLEKFLELNRLKMGTKLYKHKKYDMPIYVYAYNNTSIRSTIGVDDMTLAKRIAAYNRRVIKNNLLSGYYTDTEILWVPEHLLMNCAAGENEKIISPVVTSIETTPHVDRPIFGPAESKVAIKGSKLKNKIYYLVSGHGGPDPGALYKTDTDCLCEDEYAYDVTLRLAKNLLSQGAEVEIIIQDKNDGIRDQSVLACDKDEKCLDRGAIPLNQLSRLNQRTEVINDHYLQRKKKGKKDQQVIVIHVDSRPKNHRQDVFFMHTKGSKRSKKLAERLYDTFKNKYKKFRPDRSYDGEVVSRNLYILRNTYPKAVFIELANIANRRDRIRIMKKENRQTLADWIYEGLAK